MQRERERAWIDWLAKRCAEHMLRFNFEREKRRYDAYRNSFT